MGGEEAAGGEKQLRFAVALGTRPSRCCPGRMRRPGPSPGNLHRLTQLLRWGEVKVKAVLWLLQKIGRAHV